MGEKQATVLFSGLIGFVIEEIGSNLGLLRAPSATMAKKTRVMEHPPGQEDVP